MATARCSPQTDIPGMKIAARNLPTEEQCVRIRVIDSHDCLGYRGVGREEHSGENTPIDGADLFADLADNAPKQVPPEH